MHQLSLRRAFTVAANDQGGMGVHESEHENVDAHVDEDVQAAFQRMQRRARRKALQLELAIEQERRHADKYLAAQERALARIARDQRVDALLALRREGKPIAEALSEVDQRFNARASARGAR